MEVNDILTRVNRMKKQKRLKIVEEILKNINQEEVKKVAKKSIFEIDGCLTTEDVQIIKEAILDSRKVDANEW